MDLRGAIYGFGERGDDRETAALAVARALHGMVALDARVAKHPLRAPWLCIEREFALASAARETGSDADPQSILAARLGSFSLPRDHVQLGDLDDRARRWAPIAQRKGLVELRVLVARLAPVRRVPDLVGLAERVAYTLEDCTQPAWEVYEDPATGLPNLRSLPSGPDAVDAGDLALALPFALRRIGVTTSLLPGLVGRPRLFAREDGAPLDDLARWAATLERQAGEGAARLRLLEAYGGQVERALAGVRRPQALRRLVALALANWSVWAAQVARDTRVDISSAWRTIEQATELGVLVAVPAQRRSRGDATLYAAPPWLRMAGLISVRPGRPAKTVFTAGDGAGLGDAIVELEAAMAATERLSGAIAAATTGR